MKYITLSLLFSCLIGFGFSATLSVALDGSQAYTTIQSAINASAHGDVVLVYPGRYLENLRFYGKNITLASLEYTTGDVSYKYTTIIDGNNNGPVIYIRDSESNVTIRGLGITNGSGAYSTTYHVTMGGGILAGTFIGQKQLNIINCRIYGNSAGQGGGMSLSACNVFLSGVSIVDNHAEYFGGYYYYGSSVTNYTHTYDPNNRCNIYNNYGSSGTDLNYYWVNSVHVVVDTFTVAQPTNYYASAVPRNSSISNPYTFNILNHSHTEINQDLYVAPWGDDSNSGLSPFEPMQNIFMAMYKVASDSLNPKTVHVAPGRYTRSQNNQFFPICIKNHTRLQGASSSECVLDSEGGANILGPSTHSKDIQVKGLHLTNATGGMGAGSHGSKTLLEDLIIDNISHQRNTGGIATSESRDITISNVRVSNVTSNRSATGIRIGNVRGTVKLLDVTINDCSSGEWMPTLHLSTKDESDILLDRCKFYNNSNFSSDVQNTILQIGSIYPDTQRMRVEIRNSSFFNNYQRFYDNMARVGSINDSLIISNCTFANNTGGSAVIAVSGNINMRNNIFWNPGVPTEVLIFYYNPDVINPSNSRFEYNNIRGGIAGVNNEFSGNPMYWGSGNLNLDPLFSGIGNHPYTLSVSSPLIDMGMPNHEHLNLGDLDAGGNARLIDGNDDGQMRIDIGAYEYQNMPAPFELSALILDAVIFLQWQMPQVRKRILGRELCGYRIFRNGTAIADIGDVNQFQYLDMISQSDTLRYVVVALYGYVESAPSNEVVVYIEVSNADVHSAIDVVQMNISPNPFVASCKIELKIHEAAPVEVGIFNLRGQRVKHLMVKEILNKGEHSLLWDGTDNEGRHLASGVYFLSLNYGRSKVLNKRVVLIK